MITTQIKSLREKLILLVLFLFAIAFMNRSGYIYAAAIVVMLVFNSVRISFGASEIALFIFSALYFVFYIYNYSFDLETVILYLLAPWTAYILGKLYVERSADKNAFFLILFVLSFGMFLHGVLNWYAYIISDHYATKSYLRESIDFWRGDKVRVTSTGMLFIFATGLSVGTLFASVKRVFKIFALFALAVCVAITLFFANRTLIVVFISILAWKVFWWMISPKVAAIYKYIAVCITFLGVLFIVAINIINDGFISEWISSLKIVDRFLNESGDDRFDLVRGFFSNFNFLRFPFGGGELSYAVSDHAYLHNMWLDVYNVVGIFPFVPLLVFTCIECVRFREFKTIMLSNGKHTEYTVFQCIVMAFVLNCFAEPIIDSNPYYFMMMLIVLGAKEGLINKIRCDNGVINER